jgi:hypothetical protein
VIAIAVPATISASTIQNAGDIPSDAAGDGEAVAVGSTELVDGAAVTVEVEVDVVVDVDVEVVVVVDVEVVVVVEVSVDVFVDEDVSDSCSLWLGATDSVPEPDPEREGVGSVGIDTETLGKPDGSRDDTAELTVPHPAASTASASSASARSRLEGRFIPIRSFPAAWT